MSSYRTIIDHLAELSPQPAINPTITAALRLMPQGENLADAESVYHDLEASTQAWATRLAYESLRGWSWPYWINAQTNPANPNALNATHQPLMFNICARDLRPLIQSHSGHFAGTLDSRGMFTPPGQNFSLEVWFRVGKQIILPSRIFNSSQITYEPAPDGISVQMTAAGYTLNLTAVARELEGFAFVSMTGSVTRDSGHSHSDVSSPSAVYFALRPYTPDGVTPVHDLVYNSKGFWMSDSKIIALFAHRPDISWTSDARHGDSGMFILAPPERTAVRCAAGMASAISAFHISPESNSPAAFECILPLTPVYPREIPIHLFVAPEVGSKRKSTITAKPVHHEDDTSAAGSNPLLQASLEQLIAVTDVASPACQRILLQRNHWIVSAVRALCMYEHDKFALRLLNYCALGLGRNGYLPQSHGKWGFAGQYLTALADIYRLRGQQPDEAILRYTQIKSIARWISRKRRDISHSPKKPAGLFPPGLTRDGIGREYQLADNIWGIEGLASASWLARQFGAHADADYFHAEATHFASQLNSAIHRELEYGIMQKVPGRLHRAFDPVSAAELLDLAITEEAREMLAPRDAWLTEIISELMQPLHKDYHIEPGVPQLTRMDERGVSPARHMMLAVMCNAFAICDGPQIQAIDNLATPSGTWADIVDPRTRTGRGALHFDPEAAALYLLLTWKLKDMANNHGT